ncbi:type I restriction-modification system subunit M [Intestinibaculum porci]|uniref:site-specific DNA-methyltransferase (adenine-specific) n=2 Tax=Intestinibaculum porci TaxID=2487118 RepID=A0A3G9J5Y1_9FIRM|nr:type I restriction-modification system subunit M [Intestinibaculum porci]
MIKYKYVLERKGFIYYMDREQQRLELYKGIWQIANDLRGAVDGWDFKNYVLGMLFYRYISENMTGYINKGEHDAGNTDFDYAEMSDEDAKEAREGLIEEKGFFILPSELFCNVRKNANSNENLNETLDKVFRDIEESSVGTDSERDMKGLFDDIDVNSNKLGGSVAERNKRLVSLLNGIGSMNLGSYEDNSIDAFGDAYEYLMGMYAANAGKSGGEYFTPQEVSRLLTLIGLNGRKQVNKVYDPACGSGSLLLQSAKILGNDNVRLGYYGQEKNVTTYNLCRINMFLHNIGYEKFDIAQGDTLINPQHWDDEPFDLIVSNPPYSTKWAGDSDSVLANDERFNVAGALAPKSKADLAFVMHSLSWLSNEGTAAIVCFPGIMYRGGKEKTIRKYLVERNFVDAVIQMPGNLFFGTSIQTCLLILRKAKENDKTLFIDASSEFVSATNSNKLSEENIQTIYKWYMDKKEVEHKVKFVSIDDIAKEDYNLSVSTYVEPEDTREKIDIVKLNAEIREIVKREEKLRASIDEIIAEIEGGAENE